MGGTSGTTASPVIYDYYFMPTSDTIHAGTVVTWLNSGAQTHTVTSDTAVFDSGDVVSGGNFSFTFSATGTFPYHCNIHTFMTGTITVIP